MSKKRKKKKTASGQKQSFKSSMDPHMFVRVQLKNIKMQDPYEQEKLDRMKEKDADTLVKQLEDLLTNATVLISFDQ